MDLNEGIRLLTGKAKIVLPLKAPKTSEPAAAPTAATGGVPFTTPITTTCTVAEGGTTRTFTVTIEPPAGASAAAAETAQAPGGAAGTPVFSPFQGKTELVEIKVKVGDTVTEGQVVAAVEAMKAKHDVKAPCAGKVLSVDAVIGTDIAAGQPIMTIGG
jgi:pyruvate carboxylase subunit B